MCPVTLPHVIIANGNISSNRLDPSFSVVLFLRCVTSIIRIAEPSAKGIIWIIRWWLEHNLPGCYKQAIQTLNTEWLPAFCALQYPFWYAKWSVNPICQELGISRQVKEAAKWKVLEKGPDAGRARGCMRASGGVPRRIAMVFNSGFKWKSFGENADAWARS